uniref:Laminin N-terminal domain-containing protein n=1 Tax=Amphimedon queenslandica TaxID=400682 RepID=A0A1X7UVM9_AMPQE
MLTAFFILIAAATIPLSSSSSCYNSKGQPILCSPPKISDILNGITPLASSTCGERAVERTCQKGGLHCSACGDGNSSLHPPEHITDSDPLTFWLSPPYSSLSDGAGNMNANISFNLNKTFIIDEIKILFRSPRPHSFSLHVSSDFGGTYFPLRYYSLSCLETYGIEEERGESEGARCTSNGVGLIPLTGGMAVYRSESTISRCH